jgi:general stress protein 26
MEDIVMPKTEKEVRGFLDDQWVATFTSVDGHNRPHAVPVWFTSDENRVHIQTDRKSVKVRNIRYNPNVAIVICNTADEAIVMRGKAHLINDEKEFKRLTQAHIDKYNRLFNIAHNTQGVEYVKLDARGRDSMGIPLFDTTVRCVVEVIPERTLFW